MNTIQELEKKLKESQRAVSELKEILEIVSHEEKTKAPPKINEPFFDDLRPADKARRRSRGHSGTKGVSRMVSSSGKVTWHTTIGYQSKQYFLGYFDTYEEARSARLEAERRLGVKRN